MMAAVVGHTTETKRKDGDEIAVGTDPSDGGGGIRFEADFKVDRKTDVLSRNNRRRPDFDLVARRNGARRCRLPRLRERFIPATAIDREGYQGAIHLYFPYDLNFSITRSISTSSMSFGVPAQRVW